MLQTLQELYSQLPNGFHDMHVERITLDFARRLVTLEGKIWVTDCSLGSEVEQEDWRHGILTLEGLLHCFFDPPDPNYPYAEAKPAWLVDMYDEEESLPHLKNLPEGAFAARFFVNQWNSFIHVAASNAVLRWTDG
jgi:hypothetical protein